MKTKNFSGHQINWASKHDWFAFGTSDAIYAWDISSQNGVANEPKIMKLTSWTEMWNWAGY